MGEGSLLVATFLFCWGSSNEAHIMSTISGTKWTLLSTIYLYLAATGALYAMMCHR